MAYCTYEDVQSLVGKLWTGGSQPAKDRVTETCIEVSLEIDSVLAAAGYTTQATGTDDLALLKLYAKQGAACQSFHAAFWGDEAPDRVKHWCKSYSDFLSRMRRGEQKLPDQSLPSHSWSSVTLDRQDGFADAADEASDYD